MTRRGSRVDLDALFSALGDPTRRGLVAELVRQGPASASALAADATISRQAITKHLDVLASAGVVERERAGREVMWSVNASALDAGAAWLVRTGAAWDKRLDRLAAREAARG